METTIAPDSNVIILIIRRVWIQSVHKRKCNGIGDVSGGPICVEQTLGMDRLGDVLHHDQPLSSCSAV